MTDFRAYDVAGELFEKKKDADARADEIADERVAALELSADPEHEIDAAAERKAARPEVRPVDLKRLYDVIGDHNGQHSRHESEADANAEAGRLAEQVATNPYIKPHETFTVEPVVVYPPEEG